MFTDIVGSTALRDGLVASLGTVDGDQRYREQYLDPHNARIRGFIKEHNGFEVKTIGDSFMVAFAQPSDAVLCAVAIQRSLREQPIVPVRIGMHTGTANVVGNSDYDGHAVNIAARVESLLEGGERVYCSQDTATMARNLPGIEYHSYGPYVLKGVSQKIEIMEVVWDAALKLEPPKQPQDRLPYPWLTNWVGREREMTALETALHASKLTTLHGMGGVGKTRLAVETLLARGRGLPRDVVFVSLELARDVLTAVRDALGLTEVDASDLETLCRHLHGGDRLLLLDNFESVIGEASVARRLATTPGVKVLVTSQQPLNIIGEKIVELDPMATPECRELFINLAQQRDTTWQPEDEAAMREVLAATDGLPYLIELVAAVAPKRQLRQLAEELKTRLTKVQAQVKDEARPARHASVQACLEWALDRLPQTEREGLPRLAIFADGFDAEAAEAVAETPLSSLDTLVDAAFLRFDRATGRYSMLTTTRQFARKLLTSEEQERLDVAHGAWFIERLIHADVAIRAAGGEKQAAARLWITTELENVQQAAGWAEGADPARFEETVMRLGFYLQQTCRFSEHLRLNETLLRQLSPEEQPQLWARTQVSLGIAYSDVPIGNRSQNMAKAIACNLAALSIYTETDFPTAWAMVQNNMGTAYLDLLTGDQGENLTRAIGCFEAALRVWTKRDSPTEWAATQDNLAIAYGDLATGDRDENLTKAVVHFERALQVRTERDFPIYWAMTQNNLGATYDEWSGTDRGEHRAKAIDCYEAALRVWTEREFPVDWAMTQDNLGNAYAHGDDLAKAITCYEAALRVRTEIDFPKEWAVTQYNLGNAHEKLARDESGDHRQQAITCFEAAARGYAAVGLTEKAENARQRAAALSALPS